MPFVEIIKRQVKECVRIYSYGQVGISSALYRKYFKGKKVQIFHDNENKKIGLKPSDNGYKFWGKRSHMIACASLSNIVTGEFYPEWSEKHGMLVISYA